MRDLGNPLEAVPGSRNADLEKSLEELPDKVADALLAWRRTTLEREKLEAILFLRFKGGEFKRTGSEIEAMVQSDGGRFEACLNEAKAESDYRRLDERLMSWKKLASLRTAF